MRHYLGGEKVHVPLGEIVRENAELEEYYQDAEAGALARPLDPCEHRPRAADQRGAALDQTFGGGLAATQPSTAADEILHRADRGIARRHKHLEALTQEIVEQGLDRPARLFAGAIVGLGDIDRLT